MGLANGRITTPSFKKYRLLGPVSRTMFRRLTYVCAQDERYAARFFELGVRDNLAPVELPSSPLLAEILKGAGFRTGAFVSSIVLERRGGFGRGFDRYDDEFPKSQNADLMETLQKPGADSLRAAVALLDAQRAAEHIFLWLHLYEPHDPY